MTMIMITIIIAAIALATSTLALVVSLLAAAVVGNARRKKEGDFNFQESPVNFISTTERSWRN